MKTLIEKKQEFAAKVAQSRKFLDAGDMDAYGKIDAEIDAMGDEIDALEKQEQREAALSAVSNRKTVVQPDNSTPSLSPFATPEYKAAFMDAVRSGGLNGISAESRQVIRNALSTKTDPAGGFLVMPAEMENQIRELAQNMVAMRKLATVIRSTADRKFPFAVSYGAATWIGENGAYSKTDDVFGVVTIGSNKLGKIVLVSEELLNDTAFDLQAIIARSFAVSFSNGEEAGFISGTGVNQPLGVLANADNGVTAAAQTAIVADEIIDLYYSLNARYENQSTWLMNRSTEKLIRKLKNVVTGDYIWQPGLTVKDPATLLNRPIVNSDYMPAATAGNKAIALGDFSQYIIKDTIGMEMSVLRELYAENGQVGFKGNERVDGALVLKEAVKTLTMKV